MELTAFVEKTDLLGFGHAIGAEIGRIWEETRDCGVKSKAFHCGADSAAPPHELRAPASAHRAHNAGDRGRFTELVAEANSERFTDSESDSVLERESGGRERGRGGFCGV